LYAVDSRSGTKSDPHDGDAVSAGRGVLLVVEQQQAIDRPIHGARRRLDQRQAQVLGAYPIS